MKLVLVSSSSNFGINEPVIGISAIVLTLKELPFSVSLRGLQKKVVLILAVADMAGSSCMKKAAVLVTELVAT